MTSSSCFISCFDLLYRQKRYSKVTYFFQDAKESCLVRHKADQECDIFALVDEVLSFELVGPIRTQVAFQTDLISHTIPRRHGPLAGLFLCGNRIIEALDDEPERQYKFLHQNRHVE